MQSFKSAVFVAVCVLAVVGCGEESAAADLVGLEGDATKSEEARKHAARDAGTTIAPETDAGAMTGPVADASAGQPTAVDAGTPAPVDAGTQPTADAAAPVMEPAPCTAVFYADTDRDGFGDPATALVSCLKPDGYVANASDCYDRNANAKPGIQEGRFSEHRGDGSFDYDCDGIERQRSDKLVSCPDFTAQDHQCRPPNVKPMAGDPVQIYDCYQVISRKVDRARSVDGWWQVVPACGQYGSTGLNTAWSRETGYTCVTTANQHTMQTCN